MFDLQFIKKHPSLTLVIAGILWSFSAILIKEIQWTALGIAGVRSLIATLVQIFFCKDIKLSRLNTWQWLGILCLSANTIILVFAFQLTRAANAVFLHYAGILLLAVLSWPLLGERLGKRDWIAVVVAVLGIFALVGDGIDLSSIQGNLLGVLCGITLALGQICLRMQAKTQGNALETIVLANGLTAFLSLGTLIVTGHATLPSHPQDYVLLLALGIIPWAIPDLLYAKAIENVPALRAMLLAFLDPVLSAFWPLLFICEWPSAQGIFGCALISAAILWLESGRRAASAPAQPELVIIPSES